MFEHLASYDVILVSGPQRSGTTIAAKMIAWDTGHRHVDEEEYNTYDVDAFKIILKQRGVVVQCPTMSHLLHKIAIDGILIVFMMRDLADIRASELRVGWTVGPYPELYNLGMTPLEARAFRMRGGQVAALKYDFWRNRQRALIPHFLELEYESLSGHPLWVPKEERAGFSVKQTEKGNSDA